MTATLRRNGAAAEKPAAILAEAADLLADPSIGKLKRCEADDCVLLFLPASSLVLTRALRKPGPRRSLLPAPQVRGPRFTSPNGHIPRPHPAVGSDHG
ncbi:hypothetical protein ACQPXH_07480 [Nocardia sp. CA-135953]|uniref:hypothetical protein n=1 Tax=Nocardia sp. CA-135953 TaxID=3239978 RepID=UPI003D986A2C